MRGTYNLTAANRQFVDEYLQASPVASRYHQLRMHQTLVYQVWYSIRSSTQAATPSTRQLSMLWITK